MTYAPQLLLRARAAIEQSEIGVRADKTIAIPDISIEIPGKNIFCFLFIIARIAHDLCAANFVARRLSAA